MGPKEEGTSVGEQEGSSGRPFRVASKMVSELSPKTMERAGQEAEGHGKSRHSLLAGVLSPTWQGLA